MSAKSSESDYFLFSILRAVFGELKWKPPYWLRSIVEPIAKSFKNIICALGLLRKQKPKFFWGALILFVLCLFGSYRSYLWYINLPKPHFLSVQIYNPLPAKWWKGESPRSLRLEFSGSAAPLSSIGKEITKGIKLSPDLPGKWVWKSDALLEFIPNKDWPVGVQEQVSFDQNFFAPHVKLEKYNLDFTTPKFVAKISKLTFYENPTEPLDKKIVGTLSLSHPVDRSSLEKAIEIKLREESIKTFASKGVKDLGYKVIYDNTNGAVYVHSEKIELGEEASEILLKIKKGVKAISSGVGSETEPESTVTLPSISDYFQIRSVNTRVSIEEGEESSRIGAITASVSMKNEDLAAKVKLYQLPKDRPAFGVEEEFKNYYWSNELEVTDEVLGRAKEIPIHWIKGEQDYNTQVSFSFNADPRSWVFFVAESGLQSFGGYKLSKSYKKTIYIDEFPQVLKIVGQGAILSMSGERKLSLLARNVRTIEIELARLKPGTITHFVSANQGTYQRPDIVPDYGFGVDNISERFVERREMPQADPGKNQYTTINLAEFLNREQIPQGLFFVKVRAVDSLREKELRDWREKNKENPVARDYDFGDDDDEYLAIESRYDSSVSDKRLILMSDLGVLLKESADGSQDVFVTSLNAGGGVADARVDLLGRNGEPVFQAVTSVEGRASFPSTRGLEREKTPIAYVVTKANDISFLPYRRQDRTLNFSRFDIGGVYSKGRNEALQAFMFSDRGAYRPGETAHLGILVKRFDLQNLPSGIPLELVGTNPRGAELVSKKVKLSESGFLEYSFKTEENFQTGGYWFSLYLLRDGKRDSQLTSSRIRVEEFQPDRLKVKSQWSVPTSPGWISPQNVHALVQVDNLYGTPAANKIVRARMELNPAHNYFKEYSEYSFYTPNSVRSSFNEELGEVKTDDLGRAAIDLNLTKFVSGTYSLRLIAEAFEEAGGRSVIAESSALVSTSDYLLGFKTDGSPDYIPQGAELNYELLALNQQLTAATVESIKAEIVQVRFVSTLVQQSDGTFSYESVRREIPVSKFDISLTSGRAKRAFLTQNAGTFILYLRDKSGLDLNRINYQVIGRGEDLGNFNLERNAELKLSINKKVYEANEEIEINIIAPFSGAGLITIERDKVYAAKWFKSEGENTVEKIKLPSELEGNGYVTVTFVRSLDSREIFLNPLSFGVVPFDVSKVKLFQKINLDVPELVKPGNALRIGYETGVKADIAIFAVDEGILQFARHVTPDPLTHFLRKRALEVKTSQILDLLLPEYRILKEVSGIGGDQGALNGRFLNPFKRENEPPVAFWSGIISTDGTKGFVEYKVPDSFNGGIRVMAVAVNETQVGSNEKATKVKGDFVLQPHAPYFVAPNDEFQIGTIVTNNVEGSGAKAKLQVAVTSCDAIAISSEKQIQVEVPEGKEVPVFFAAKAKNIFGACPIKFTVKGLEKQAEHSLEMSVRPALPLATTVTAKSIKPGMFSSNSSEIKLTRKLNSQGRLVTFSASVLPLGLANGLVHYLDEYPYGCTEQVVSKAFSRVILGVEPELGLEREDIRLKIDYVIKILQSRQNSEGGFGLWSAGSDVDKFISVYATHFLLEAKEHGYEIPTSLLSRGLEYLKSIASSDREDAYSESLTKAYAIYLLTRSGILTTNWLTSFRENLEQEQKLSDWDEGVIAAFLSATYQMLKLEKDAKRLLNGVSLQSGHGQFPQVEYDPNFFQSLYFYLLARHFPDKAKSFGEEELSKYVDRVLTDTPSTLSSGLTILALRTYGELFRENLPDEIKVKSLLMQGKTADLSLEGKTFLSAILPEGVEGVVLTKAGSSRVYLQLTETGYDTVPRTSVVNNSIEVYHQLMDENGRVVSEMKLTDRVFVHLYLRALDRDVQNVAVVDLLPGGFELDLNPDTLGSRISLETSGEAAGIETWYPQHIEAREDRIIFFGDLDTKVRKFIYRIKPLNLGKYTVPPAYAEGMYDRRASSQALATEITVTH